MPSSLAGLVVVSIFAAVAFSPAHSSVLKSSIHAKRQSVPQKPNFVQQLAINQIVNVLPLNAREGINDAAALFKMTRNEFLLRCLKELQAFQNHTKVDFITAIQKTIKFVEDRLSDEQQKQLEALEQPGIELATLLFANKLKPGQLTEGYALIVKVVRQQIDPQAFVDALPILVQNILSQHA